VLSPAARQFLGTLLAVMLIGGAVLGVVIMGVFSATRAYQEYQLQQIDAKVAARAKEAEKLFGQGRYLEAAQIYDQLYRSAQSTKWKDEFRRNTASALTMHGNQLLEARRYEEALQASISRRCSTRRCPKPTRGWLPPRRSWATVRAQSTTGRPPPDTVAARKRKSTSATPPASKSPSATRRTAAATSHAPCKRGKPLSNSRQALQKPAKRSASSNKR
jgi:DNA-binding SARP family transcriptional activator